VLGRSGFITRDVPGATDTIAFGNNAGGEIAGMDNDASGAGRGFLLSKGNVATIHPPGSELTIAFVITPDGRIAGSYVDARSGAFRGFLAERVKK
jgi:hypothetical protein